MGVDMRIETVSDFDAALANGAYAWPGGYPLYFVTDDGGCLCFKAAALEAQLIRDAIAADDRQSGWRVVACEVNWEDETLICEHTGAKIESAYGTDD